MTDKLLVCALDALDEYNIYQLDLQYIQSLYEDNGDIFTCSTLPHTAVSNPMLFGGVVNDDKFWVEREDGLDGDDTGEYVDPAAYFDRESGEPVDGARGFSREVEYDDESFIWDDLYAVDIDARAVQVPIVLPPYSFRATDTLDESWFPDSKERMAEHIRQKPALLAEQFEDGADAVFSSIQMPDKWLHAIGEDTASQQWVLDEAPVLDQQVKQLVEYCESNDIDWLFFGDHGSPHPGAMKKNGYILPRHRKESIILSSLDVPTYSDELYPWLLDYYDVEPVGGFWFQPNGERAEPTDAVADRLQNLGYL